MHKPLHITELLVDTSVMHAYIIWLQDAAKVYIIHKIIHKSAPISYRRAIDLPLRSMYPWNKEDCQDYSNNCTEEWSSPHHHCRRWKIV